MRDYVRRVFARDKLVISVVGDIDAETLGRKLDEVFGPLPQHSALAPIADAKPPMGPTREIIEMEVPQSVAQFGHRAFPRKDDDFIAAVSQMPPASGCALGFDRLVMLATGATRIDEVLWTPQQRDT